MDIQVQRAIVPVAKRARRWALAGSIVGAETMLATFAVSSWYSFAEVSFVTVASAGFFAFVTFVVGYALQHRASSLRRIQRDLEQAAQMRERGLIDENDYLRLKAQALENFRPGAVTIQRLWPATLWAALAGMTFALGGFAFDTVPVLPAIAVTAGSAVVGGTITGGAALVVEVIRRRLSHPRLPAPENNWRMLGE